MNLKVVCGVASTGLILIGIWLGLRSDEPHAPIKLVARENSSLLSGQQGSSETASLGHDQSRKPELPAANESNVTKTSRITTDLVAQSASLAAAPQVPEIGSVPFEQMSKQELFGSKGNTQDPVVLDRPLDRHSPEFAAMMADKNAATNAFNAKQAAKALLSPEAPTTQNLSNNKAPL